MRPAAAALDVAIRGGQALASGSLAGLQAGAQELPNVSPVTGEGYVKESLASLLNPRQAGEAAVQGIEARILGAPEFANLPAPPNLPAAVAAKIIPGGDSTYFGYTNPVHGVMDGTGALVDDAKKSVANENAPEKPPTATPRQPLEELQAKRRSSLMRHIMRLRRQRIFTKLRGK